jgi:RHS repeat-associated protein
VILVVFGDTRRPAGKAIMNENSESRPSPPTQSSLWDAGAQVTISVELGSTRSRRGVTFRPSACKRLTESLLRLRRRGNEPYLMLGRYYGSSLGRFITVDPSFDVQFAEPQSWNKYTYVRNNPINRIDNNGAFSIPIHTQITRDVLSSMGMGGLWVSLAIQSNVQQDMFGGGRLHYTHHATGLFGTKEDIGSKAKEYAERQLAKAIMAANVNGRMDVAIEAVGKGLHTIQDLVAHEEFRRLFDTLGDPVQFKQHGNNDRNPTPDEKDCASEDSREYVQRFVDAVGGIDVVNQAIHDYVLAGENGKGSFFQKDQEAHRTAGGYVDSEGTHFSVQGPEY